MTKRETLMEQEYFDKWVAYERGRLQEMEAKLAASTAPPANKAKYRYSMFRKEYELLVLRYSQGEAISALKDAFPAVIGRLESYHTEGPHEGFSIQEEIDEYVTALWLVSLALLFEVDDPLFERLVNLIGNEGSDRLYERLVGTRIKNRPQAEKLLYPKPYRLLNDAIDAPAGSQPRLMAEFLKVWYPAMKKAYWYESHHGPDGGGFFGYWCIEAAGVVKAFRIDDSAFRDSAYYPKDLVTAGPE